MVKQWGTDHSFSLSSTWQTDQRHTIKGMKHVSSNGLRWEFDKERNWVREEMPASTGASNVHIQFIYMESDHILPLIQPPIRIHIKITNTSFTFGTRKLCWLHFILWNVHIKLQTAARTETVVLLEVPSEGLSTQAWEKKGRVWASKLAQSSEDLPVRPALWAAAGSEAETCKVRRPRPSLLNTLPHWYSSDSRPPILRASHQDQTKPNQTNARPFSRPNVSSIFRLYLHYPSAKKKR